MLLSDSVLKKRLGDAFSLQLYEEVDSTNTLAREQATAGAPEGTVILASAQRQGRGRMGRQFFSPKGSGLYMSIILRPSTAVLPLYITTAAAVAVAEAIEEVAGISASIKWVNDVYCREKKVCGILTEGAIAENLQYAVLGIGINVLSPIGGFPPEIESRAGAVFGEKTPPTAHPREELAAAIIARFWGYYEALSAKAFLPSYRKRDLLKGRIVQVLDVNGTVIEEVTAQGITDTFELLVTDRHGKTKALSSGEVSLRL